MVGADDRHLAFPAIPDDALRVPRECAVGIVEQGEDALIAEILEGLTVCEVLPLQHQGKLSYAAVHYWALVDSFCIVLQEKNTNFNRRRFLKAADCPYFDEVIMGVPFINCTCERCEKDFRITPDEEGRTLCDDCQNREE